MEEASMLGRRTFCALAAGALAAPRIAWGQAMTSQAFFYVSLAPALRRYRIDVDGASLTPQREVTLPENIQYAWPHSSAPFLYVA
jgi:6-phosphogluconolactonase